TLMGKAWAMWLSCDLPPNYWDEFILTSCYLSNHVLVKSLPGLNPFEAWHGFKPNLCHLHEIGSCAFVLI
ncbi:hypothetical protein BS17DRAFT_686013, partial [Gyrodon lividus]